MIRLAGGGGGGSAGPAAIVTQLKGSGAGNYTTVSAVHVAVDAVNLAKALTTPVSQVIIIWVNGTISNDSVGDYTDVVIAKDGAPVSEVFAGDSGGGVFNPFGLNYSEVGDGASHTWAIYWNAIGGTGIMANNSATDTPFINIMQIAAT